MKTVYLALAIFVFFLILFFTLQKIDEKSFIKKHALKDTECGCLKAH